MPNKPIEYMGETNVNVVLRWRHGYKVTERKILDLVFSNAQELKDFIANIHRARNAMLQNRT